MRELITVAPATKLDEPLAKHCTLKVGGPARALVTPEGLYELRAVLDVLNRHQIPFKVVGKGANLLVSDEGYDGAIVVLGDGFCWFKQIGRTVVKVGAGLSLATLSTHMARLGISGLEFAAQIPGTVGGGVVNNCGAYGHDLAGHLVEATLIRPDGEEESVGPEGLGLAYRGSLVKGGSQFCVVQATFSGTEGSPEEIRSRIAEYGRKRALSQPLDKPSAGCIFKNPPGHSAGRLIEAAGLKGATVGNAVVSEKHANFIINRGQASAQDVLDLIRLVQQKVRALFSIELETEVEFVGVR